MSCPSLPFGPEPSDHKRTCRLAAPGANTAPEAAADRASDNGGGDSDAAAAAGAVAAAEDVTRRCFPRIFLHGEWPVPKVYQLESAIEGRYPHSFRVLPPEISQANRDAITPQNGDDVDEQIIRMLEVEGVVNLTPELLRATAGDLLEKARDEAQALFEAQAHGSGEKWQVLFHGDAALNGAMRAGDEKKTMSKALNEDSAILLCMEAALSILTPDFKVGRNSNGKPHLFLLNHAGAPRFSGVHYAQAEHTVMPCHGGGDHFSHRTLPACLRPDGPRVMWMDLSKEPIALYFHRRSHHVSRMVNQFFVHYGPLWAEYLQTHPGSDEEDFKPIWAVLVEQHVQGQCASLGIQVEPEADLNTVQSCGAMLFQSLMLHGGTSDPGLRAFAIVLKDKDQGTVELPHGSIELVETSRIYAGVMDVVLKPLEVVLANRGVAVELAKNFKCASGPNHRDRLRSATTDWEEALLQVLDQVGSKWGVRPRPAPDNTPLTVKFKHSHSFFGLVCSIVGRGRLEGGTRKVVLWLESKTSHPERGSLFRNSAFSLALNQVQERRAPESLKAVSSFLHARTPVTEAKFHEFSLLYSPVCMDGEPLRDRLRRDLGPWKADHELTEEFRNLLSGLLQAVDRLENDGFRFVVWDENVFSITSEDHVKLMYSGGGFLGQKKRALCDRKQATGPLASLRRNTSMYLDDFLASTKIRADCNMRRLQKLADRREAKQADEASLSALRDSADMAPGPGWRNLPVSDSDVRNWLLAQSGKSMGVVGRWDVDPVELLVDKD